MSVDRDPRVGDLHHYGGSQFEVTAVGERLFLEKNHETGDENSESIATFRACATLGPRRPRVANRWGYLTPGGAFHSLSGEYDARRMTDDDSPHRLARIIGGSVCDEHGVPFEAES